MREDELSLVWNLHDRCLGFGLILHGFLWHVPNYSTVDGVVNSILAASKFREQFGMSVSIVSEY